MYRKHGSRARIERDKGKVSPMRKKKKRPGRPSRRKRRQKKHSTRRADG